MPSRLLVLYTELTFKHVHTCLVSIGSLIREIGFEIRTFCDFFLIFKDITNGHMPYHCQVLTSYVDGTVLQLVNQLYARTSISFPYCCALSRNDSQTNFVFNVI